jgi:hypothetical protein
LDHWHAIGAVFNTTRDPQLLAGGVGLIWLTKIERNNPGWPQALVSFDDGCRMLGRHSKNASSVRDVSGLLICQFSCVAIFNSPYLGAAS